MDFLNCYICNAETKLRNSVRIRTKTKYSGTGVHEIIQSFLKQAHSLRFSPNDIVCERCFQKINQYDLACRMADDIQQEITNALYITEQEFLSEEHVEYLEDLQGDKNACQKDFEEFQERYDMQNSVDNAHVNVENANEHTTHIDKSVDKDEISIESTSRSLKPSRRGYASCEECEIPFITKKELKQHQIRYHTPKKCGVCQQMFASQMELRTHTRQNHEIEHNSNDESELGQGDIPTKENETNQSNFRCDICGLLESTKELLTEHVALHENQLKCVICGTILKHKGNLVLHMRIHADKKFFKCDKCEKTFVHKSSLRMHLQTTHTDVRSKQCPECPLKFKTTSQLNQHMVTHTGIKKHQCPECGKAFGQKYNMTAHYKSHFFNKIQRKTRINTEQAASTEDKMDH